MGLQSRTTGFGSREPLIGLGAYSLGAYIWGPTISEQPILELGDPKGLGAYSLGAYIWGPTIS